MKREELWLLFMHAAIGGAMAGTPDVTSINVAEAALAADLALNEFCRRFPGQVQA